MKRKVIWFFSLLILLAGSGITYYYFNTNSNDFPKFQTELERLTYVSKNESSIDENFKLEGHHVRNGGPYKAGTNILGYGVAVKVEPMGWRIGLDDVEDKQKFAVFKLHFYNFNNFVYDLKLSDIVLHYGDKVHSEQPLTEDGYGNWKYIKGAFEFEPIGTSTYRNGYIFFPVNDHIKEGGFIRITLQNIPIDIQF